MTTPIAPTYLSGKSGSILIRIEGTTPVTKSLPVTDFSGSETSGTFDATNADTKGYEWPEAGTQKCEFSGSAMWKKAGGAPPMKTGHIYFMKLNTQPGEFYSGNALITAVSSTGNVKGERKYSFSGQFQGVYNSPSNPTAIADSEALPPVGDFTPPLIDDGTGTP
jgi:hypothetical protein